eukprot:scaffold176_cov103-Phaeocystis_antarctica.AAC.2
MDSAPVTEGLAHTAHEVVGDAAHLCARQATRPHGHLGNRKFRLEEAVVTTVDEQRRTTSAARCGANVDSVHQLQLRPCIGSAHDHQSVIGLTLPWGDVFHCPAP